MRLKDMSREELELLSYTDLTDLILKENQKPMNTPTIFRTICDLLGYSDSEYTDKIGEYYTSLTTDKRFVLLDTAEWDLKDNHAIPLVIDDDELEGDMEEDIEEEEEDEVMEEDDDSIDSVIDDEIDDTDEEMEDLSIIADEEIEEDN